jgi:hypothetical protein
MPWGEDQDAGLLDFYRRLIAFRRTDPGVWRGERRTAVVDDPAGVYAYACGTGPATVLVVLNNGTESYRFAVPGGGPWRLAMATDDAVATVKGTVVLPSRSGAALVTEGSGDFAPAP